MNNRKTNKNPFKEIELINIFYQLFSGLEHAHNNYIIHRDIKLENILISTDKQIKICDWGLSKFMNREDYGNNKKIIMGTPLYYAPEVILRDEIDYKIDIWAAGVCMYILCEFDSPFKGNNKEVLKFNILKANINYVSLYYSKSFTSIINNCLINNKTLRYSSSDCILRFKDLNKFYNDKNDEKVIIKNYKVNKSVNDINSFKLKSTGQLLKVNINKSINLNTGNLQKNKLDYKNIINNKKSYSCLKIKENNTSFNSLEEIEKITPKGRNKEIKFTEKDNIFSSELDENNLTNIPMKEYQIIINPAKSPRIIKSKKSNINNNNFLSKSFGVKHFNPKNKSDTSLKKVNILSKDINLNNTIKYKSNFLSPFLSIQSSNKSSNSNLPILSDDSNKKLDKKRKINKFYSSKNSSNNSEDNNDKILIKFPKIKENLLEDNLKNNIKYDKFKISSYNLNSKNKDFIKNNYNTENNLEDSRNKKSFKDILQIIDYNAIKKENKLKITIDNFKICKSDKY